MHSSARRAVDEISSVSPSSVDPNRRLKCVDRKDPSASAANSGTVIMGRLKQSQTISWPRAWEIARPPGPARTLTTDALLHADIQAAKHGGPKLAHLVV